MDIKEWGHNLFVIKINVSVIVSAFKQKLLLSVHLLPTDHCTCCKSSKMNC